VTMQEIRAWGVHLFTMSGAVCGFMALTNIVNNEPKDAIWWLILALIIRSGHPDDVAVPFFGSAPQNR